VPERWLEADEALLHPDSDSAFASASASASEPAAAAAVRDKRAFIPFGYGAHACVGKGVALGEMKIVVARVCAGFDVEFATGVGDGKEAEEEEEEEDAEERERAWEREWKDYAVLKTGRLGLRFRSVSVSG